MTEKRSGEPNQESYKKLIRNWHKKARNEKDYFSKFVFEYLAFIAIIVKIEKLRTENKDRTAIQNFKKQYKEKLGEKYSKKINPNLKNLINYLKEKPLTESGNLKWWNCSELRLCMCNGSEQKNDKGVIKDSCDWEHIVEFIYYIRNNLFHGDKDPEDGRDQCLVEHAYKLLNPLVEILLAEKGTG